MKIPVLLISMMLGGFSESAITQNLVINGDVETGDFTGWTTTNGLEVYDDENAVERGTAGLSVSTDIGRYSFHGGTGPAISDATQLIPLSDYLTDILSGQQAFEFSVALQSRTAGVTDQASAVLTFLDGSDQEISSESFVDSSADGFAWTEFTLIGILPALTESVQITVDSRRGGFSSTDAYIDNVSFALVPEASSALMVMLASLFFLGRKR